MVAIGMALMWAGYAVGLWGYALVQGYDLPFTALFRTSWPQQGQASAGGVGTPPAGAAGAPKAVNALWD